MDGAELKRKTFHSVAWTALRVAASNVSSFVVFSVLARVLSPHDFGVFALATLVVELTRIVASAGLSDAVTRAPDLDEAFADTAFWANLGLGGLVGALAWAAAPLYAAIVRQPEVVPVLRWLAALVPVASLAGIHTARTVRAFGHKALAARMVAAGLLAGAVAVAAAVEGCGVWSLVFQAAVFDVAGVVFAWWNFPWRPRLRFDPRALAGVGGFSASMMLTQVMLLTLVRIQDVVIGRFVSAAATGSYRVAWRMIDLIVQTTIQPIVGVSMVTLSTVQSERERFGAAFLRMLGLGALFTFPALFGFGVLSDEIIALLFGPNWAGSGDVAKILTLMAVPFTLNFFCGPALAALGRGGAIARAAAVQAALTLAFALVAAPYGLPWIAAAYVVRAHLTMPYQMLLLRRAAGIPPAAMVRAVLPPFLAALAMVAVLLAAAPALRRGFGDGAVYVAVAAPLGAAVFAAALLAFAGGYVRSNLAAVQPLWRRGLQVAERAA